MKQQGFNKILLLLQIYVAFYKYLIKLQDTRMVRMGKNYLSTIYVVYNKYLKELRDTQMVCIDKIYHFLFLCGFLQVPFRTFGHISAVNLQNS